VNHPRHELDPLIHSPIRLSIMATLVEVAEAEFGTVAAVVEITPPTLSKQMTLLEQAGYVAVRKGYNGRRPRTWLSLTDTGRDRFTTYLEVLRRIAAWRR
jgi:DNA-binding MarR family transcriptional regulator